MATILITLFLVIILIVGISARTHLSKSISDYQDRKLRKWCMKMAADTSDIHHSELYRAANKIYEWVNGMPESET